MKRFLLAASMVILMSCSAAEEAPAPDPAPDPEPAATAVTAPDPAPAAEAAPAPADADGEAADNPLLDVAAASRIAPETYVVKLETTKGDILIDVTRAWAPNGADRFYNLVSMGYYNDIAFFRVIEGFMAQFGIHGDPAVARVWKEAQIEDDPVTQSNGPGMLTFATAGPNTRTTQLFINFGDNGNLDGMGFAPFGKLRAMDVLNKINSEYGEGAPRGRGPHQGRVQSQGNAYLKASFPNLDYITKATIVVE